MSDKQLLDLFFARDEEAIRQTDLTYGRRLQTLAAGILQSKQDAEESVNDTYLKTWNVIPPQRPSFFYAFLAKICRHCALDRVDWNGAAKRKTELLSLTQELESCIPDEENLRRAEAKELRGLLDAFLRTLTPENRVLFLRRYWYRESIRTLARRAGMGESAVRMRLTRTREKLRAFLEKEGITV